MSKVEIELLIMQIKDSLQQPDVQKEIVEKTLKQMLEQNKISNTDYEIALDTLKN